MTLGKFSAVFTASMQSAVNTIGSWNGMHADYVNFSGKNLNKYSRKEGLDTPKSEPARAQQCERARF
jgi:hypothetical protein